MMPHPCRSCWIGQVSDARRTVTGMAAPSIIR
jgi:hypothetical protein